MDEEGRAIDRALQMEVEVNSILVPLMACKEETQLAYSKGSLSREYSRALSKLKALAPEYAALGRVSSAEGQAVMDALGAKLRQCAALIRELRGEEGAPDASAAAPESVVGASKPGPLPVHVERRAGSTSPRSPQNNPWQKVDLFGIVRFDFEGNEELRQLTLVKGDILFLRGEARGWFKGTIVGSENVGLIPGQYVEALTGEEAIRRLKEKEALVQLLRTQKRELHEQLDVLKTRVVGVVSALREQLVENAKLKEELEAEDADAGVEDSCDSDDSDVIEVEEEQQHEHEESAPSPIPMSELEALRARVQELENENEELRNGRENRSASLSFVTGLSGLDLDASDESNASSYAETLVAHLKDSLDESTPSTPPPPIMMLAPKMATFGVPLSWLVERDDCSVPPLVEQLCEALLEGQPKKICSRGIFRIPASSEALDDLKLRVNMHPERVDFQEEPADLLADLLKMFLRELPEPLLTFGLFERWSLAVQMEKDNAGPRAVSFTDTGPTNPAVAKQRLYVRALLATLPFENLSLVEYLINFLVLAITHSGENGLTVVNASTLFGPVFLDPPGKGEASATSGPKRSGFTPFFARKQRQTSREAVLQSSTELSKQFHTGSEVLRMLLEGHREYFAGIFAVNSFSEWKAKKDHRAIGPHDLALVKGDYVAVFARIDDVRSWAECKGKVGEVPNAILKPYLEK